MSVNNEMAIKLHEYYMNHKTMWLKIADILRTDNTIVDQMVKRLRHHGEGYVSTWLKGQAYLKMKSTLITSKENDYCFCCQADDDFEDLCCSTCIVDWGKYNCVSINSMYDNFEDLIFELVPKDNYSEDIEKLAKTAEEIANLPFRYQEDYDRAVKEGVNE